MHASTIFTTLLLASSAMAMPQRQRQQHRSTVTVYWTAGAAVPTADPVPTQVANPVVNVQAAAAASSTVAAPSASPTDYVSTALYHHNIHRANHSAKALVYNSDLASAAAQLAAKCVFAHDTTLGVGGYGQNLAASGGSAISSGTSTLSYLANSISDSWYDGEFNSFLPSYYGQANPPNFESWGHFSQVVWASTSSVGCATQFCAAGTIFSMPSMFTVCNYAQAGNMGGAYASNVLPPLGNPTV